jgi:hypothetical protein
MESRLNIIPSHRRRIAAILVTLVLFVLATPLAADTYRWKDKNGEIHYGESVPPEYADQPYDVINKQGIVIKHIEDPTEQIKAPEETKAEKKERAPLISEEERRIQSDRLLVIRYSSEDDIQNQLELELAQVGYDRKVMSQSVESTSAAIRSQVSQAADKQRAGQPITAEQQAEIDQLYSRLEQDRKQLAANKAREEKIRARYAEDLERYRFLTSESEEDGKEPADNG